MNSIRREAPGVLFCGCSHWHQSIYSDYNLVAEKISQDLLDSGITQQEFDNSKLILSFLEEGHNRDDLAPLARHFDRTHPNRFIMLNSIDFYRCMVNHGSFLDNLDGRQTITTDKKFLCLIRRASLSRAKFASSLRKTISSDNLRMSFGCGSYSSELSEYQSLFEDINLPITLDGVIDNNKISKIYDVDDSWFNAFFNIISETSSQSDPGIWKDLFITEKTFKCFAMHQVPIWWAVPGLVKKIRTLDLDLFDDIVDHSYDSIQDEDERRRVVINELHRLDQTYTLKQCQDLRNQLQPRFRANYLLLQQIKADNAAEIRSAINKFITQGF